MSKGTGGTAKSMSGGGGGAAAPVIETLLDAVSEIQQFSVIENSSKELPIDFLDINKSIKFFMIGLKSGLREGLILIIAFPFLEFWMLPFVLKHADTSMTIIFSILPFMAVLINTLICSYIARYYVGCITRKAINLLFVGRSSSLLIKALAIYIVYYFLHEIGKPDNVAELAKFISRDNARTYFDAYFEIKPLIMPAAIKTCIGLVIASLVPYASVYGVDFVRKIQRERSMKTRY